MSAPFPLPPDEQQRLATLADYRLMGTAKDESFDRLTRMATRLFDAPIALISLVGEDEQFFKSHVGIQECSTSREHSLCAHAIVQDDIMVVPDATQDPRFVDNPMVTDEPFIRFYAGAQLSAHDGSRLGTLCIIDTEPRDGLSPPELERLHDLAVLVEERMELHRRDSAEHVGRARFEHIAATSVDAIIVTDDDGMITFWNEAAENLFGYSFAEVMGRDARLLLPSGEQDRYQETLDRLRQDPRSVSPGGATEITALRADGRAFPAELSVSAWDEGGRQSIGAVVRDISERKAHERRLFRLASIDSLTGLPNRSAWNDQIEATIKAGTAATVAILDLDGFKEVNDSLGHSAGDAVLEQVADRMRSASGPYVTIARLGGDEFVALEHSDDPDRAAALGQRIIDAVTGPYTYGRNRLDIGASVGLALHPEHGRSAEMLLGSADLALYRAKEHRRGHYTVFEPEMREEMRRSRSLRRELREAFERQEFELFYQPQISTDDRRLVGAEALLRWHHPERGLVGPAAFIDELAQKPSAPLVGEWIIRTACAQAAHWRRTVPDLAIAVNLFGSQLRTGDLPERIEAALAETGLPPGALELELVETTLIEDDRATGELLERLRGIGVGLSLDDYGTGYASLSLLKTHPVSRLKVDRSFVHGVDADPENAGVVRAILYLARTFGLEVVAEGVETEEELAFLREAGCPAFQGFLVSPPVTAAEFTERFVPLTRT